jgi:hypothetical protein
VGLLPLQHDLEPNMQEFAGEHQTPPPRTHLPPPLTPTLTKFLPLPTILGDLVPSGIEEPMTGTDRPADTAGGSGEAGVSGQQGPGLAQPARAVKRYRRAELDEQPAFVIEEEDDEGG